MPRSKREKGRGANNMGTVRKRIVKKNGKEYTFWEARYTERYDPGTGKQIQRSITGKTQKEVAQKLKAILSDIDDMVYTAPTKLTVNEWLDIWEKDYLNGVKPRTAESYRDIARLHIRPGLGAVKLCKLTHHMVQVFINQLSEERNGKPGLSPKSVKNVHGVLHRSLQRAVINRYIPFNPVNDCDLPVVEKPRIRSFEPEEITEFLREAEGHRYENLYRLALFTGMREGELLGLTWDCVNFKRGTISIYRQLVQTRTGGRKFSLGSTKNTKGRTIQPGVEVMKLLETIRSEQDKQRAVAGAAWKEEGFVFTNELGEHYTHAAVYCAFKKVVRKIGLPKARFHDLRHTYATSAIYAKVDIKTISENLGHATVAFTLDKYADVIQQMRQSCADKMDQFIAQIDPKRAA